MATVQCIICNKEFDVLPYRLATAKFCSYACRSKWRSLYWSGANNPRFLPEARTLTCQHCGKEFSQGDNEPITNFRKRKFCSMECTKHGQHRLTGEEHPLYKVDSRRKNRRGKHGSWARAVLTRDLATCQKCGERDLPLHAHHIQSFAEHPEKRWDLFSNGITLCYRCHLAEHTALNAKGVNSGHPTG